MRDSPSRFSAAHPSNRIEPNKKSNVRMAASYFRLAVEAKGNDVDMTDGLQVLGTFANVCN